MSWTLRELRCFIAAVEEGSFTDAAIRLHVSQAAVSRTIGGLEQTLGRALLQRVPRGCVPTDAGLRLLDAAREVLLAADGFDRVLQQDRNVLRLGYDWAALGARTTRLQRLWAASTGGEVEWVRHGTVTAGLTEGVVDAAVVRREIEDHRLDSVVVGHEIRVAAAAADDPAARRRRPLTLAYLAARSVIVDRRLGTTDERLWPAEAQPRRVIEVADTEGWLDGIAAGRGLGVTSEATAHHHARAGVVYRPIADAPPLAVRLLWWRAHPPPRLDALTRLLSSLYTAQSDDFSTPR